MIPPEPIDVSSIYTYHTMNFKEKGLRRAHQCALPSLEKHPYEELLDGSTLTSMKDPCIIKHVISNIFVLRRGCGRPQANGANI